MQHSNLFELVEIEPGVVQGRVNGEPIDGAKYCVRSAGSTVRLRVCNYGDRFSGAIDGGYSATIDSRPVVAELTLARPTCTSCGQEVAAR